MSTLEAAVFVVAVIAIGFVLSLSFPTRDDLRAFEQIEKSVEPSTLLELGVALVVLAAVCVFGVVCKHCAGVP